VTLKGETQGIHSLRIFIRKLVLFDQELSKMVTQMGRGRVSRGTSAPPS